MTILVTGAAGFIGSELSLYLLKRGDIVIGVDNHNDYYSQELKEARLLRHCNYPKYRHIRADISDNEVISDIFKKYKPKKVINLAAQAGVRFSIDNPQSYISSNLVGFSNILEGCRHNGIEHLVYASSSSVYGANTLMPFSVHQSCNHPLSLYAATKKCNELMAHSYSHLYKVPTTGIRFFTVYGPWGRPDMALQKFAWAIMRGEPLKVFNHGNHIRDFTFIDDVVEGLVRVIDHPASPNERWSGDNPASASSKAPWRIYNIGNSRPIKLLDYISVLEAALGKRANIEFLPMQAGDVLETWANVDELNQEFSFQPSTSIESGVLQFAEWFKLFYKL